MKKADLEKQLGKKISGRMQQEPHSDRYGAASGAIADKREQRERERAAGLIPFAVKLPQDLVAKLQALAVERSATLNDVTAELLTAGLTPSTAQPATKTKEDRATTAKEDKATKAKEGKATAAKKGKATEAKKGKVTKGR